MSEECVKVSMRGEGVKVRMRAERERERGANDI